MIQTQEQPNVFGEMLVALLMVSAVIYKTLRGLVRYIRYTHEVNMHNLKWNIIYFRRFTLEHRDFVEIDQQVVEITERVNNYHTRYEGTARAA